jgi:uncharacterized oligopeptide transporter (OPT) family protein
VALSRWWQLALGAVVGALMGVYLPSSAFTIAIVIGLLLAWASLRNDGDDALTAVAAGYVTGVLGYGLVHVTLLLVAFPSA